MKDPVFAVRNFGAFDYSLGDTKIGEGPSRSVSEYEFEFYMEKRPGGLRIDGKFYQSCPGGCVLAKPGQTESVIKPYRGYFLNISTQDPELCAVLNDTPTFFAHWNMGEVIDLIHQMIAVKDKTDFVGRMQLHSLVCSILALLYRYHYGIKYVDNNMLHHQKTLNMVDKYIQEHLDKELSLAVLAKQCNLDPTYFHKLYTAAFGKTPAQRILDLRIAAAQRGLIESNISLAKLATMCGFASQTYFSYKFKQATGLTPMQYRTQILGNMPK